MSKRTLWSGLWLVAFLAGIAGLYLRLTAGHTLTAYGTAIPWGLWVALYSFLTSMAAGTYLITTLPVLFGVRNLEPVVRPALWAALAALVGGVVAIGLDLGHIARLWELIFRPNLHSIMPWMGMLYTAFAVILLLQIRAASREQQPRGLAWLGLVVSIAVATGGGAIYALVGGRGYWHSGFLPVLFLVGGLLSGTALLTLLSGLQQQPLTALRGRLGRMTLTLLVLELVLEAIEFSVGLYGGEVLARESARLALFGPYAWAFWLLHLGLGALLPMAMLALQPEHQTLVPLSGLLVVGTYLTVRLNVVIPGLAVPPLSGLAQAYQEPGLAYSYAPTLMEWLVALFVVSLSVLIFDLGYRRGLTLAKAADPAPRKVG